MRNLNIQKHKVMLLATREPWEDVWMFPALAEGQQVIKITHNPSGGLLLTLIFFY